jgi:hypothetical protein
MEQLKTKSKRVKDLSQFFSTPVLEPKKLTKKELKDSRNNEKLRAFKADECRKQLLAIQLGDTDIQMERELYPNSIRFGNRT